MSRLSGARKILNDFLACKARGSLGATAGSYFKPSTVAPVAGRLPPSSLVDVLVDHLVSDGAGCGLAIKSRTRPHVPCPSRNASSCMRKLLDATRFLAPSSARTAGVASMLAIIASKPDRRPRKSSLDDPIAVALADRDLVDHDHPGPECPPVRAAPPYISISCALTVVPVERQTPLKPRRACRQRRPTKIRKALNVGTACARLPLPETTARTYHASPCRSYGQSARQEVASPGRADESLHGISEAAGACSRFPIDPI